MNKNKTKVYLEMASTLVVAWDREKNCPNGYDRRVIDFAYLDGYVVSLSKETDTWSHYSRHDLHIWPRHASSQVPCLQPQGSYTRDYRQILPWRSSEESVWLVGCYHYEYTNAMKHYLFFTQVCLKTGHILADWAYPVPIPEWYTVDDRKTRQFFEFYLERVFPGDTLGSFQVLVSMSLDCEHDTPTYWELWQFEHTTEAKGIVEVDTSQAWGRLHYDSKSKIPFKEQFNWPRVPATHYCTRVVKLPEAYQYLSYQKGGLVYGTSPKGNLFTYNIVTGAHQELRISLSRYFLCSFMLDPFQPKVGWVNTDGRIYSINLWSQKESAESLKVDSMSHIIVERETLMIWDARGLHRVPKPIPK